MFSISLVLPQLLVPSSQFLVHSCQFFIQMYLPITNLLFTMCFSNLIQIQTIPTTTGPTLQCTSPQKTIGKHTQVISLSTLTQVNSYGQYMIRLTQQALQTYYLDQLEESENFDSIENHRPSESTKINIPTHKGKLKSGISDRFQQLTKVTMKLSEQ